MHRIKSVLIAALLLAGFTAFAQQVEVTGVVTSKADGYGVIGAAVMEKGTSNGCVTDLDGNFTLKVEAGKILEISCIGYRTIEVAAAPTLKVVIDEDVAELSEVVVTGYQTQRKADLTGSVSVIKTDEMKTTSGTDPMRALQGRVPGMTITSDGSPSGQGTVRIRGIGSFNSSQDPLYTLLPLTLSILPPASVRDAWKKDYQAMQESMIYEESPSFEQLIEKLTELNQRINAISY